jgi:hypothetical protein
MLEDLECRWKLLRAANRGYHCSGDAFSELDCAWGATALLASSIQRKSAIPQFVFIDLNRASSKLLSYNEVTFRASARRGHITIGPRTYLLCGSYFSHVCIYSLHPEQHMARLSKAAAPMYGNRISDFEFVWENRCC